MLTQPFTSVAVNVYVVVAAAFVLFDATKGTLLVTLLFQEYVSLPEVANVTFDPLHTT